MFSPAHLAWPARIAALSSGLLGASLALALVRASSMLDAAAAALGAVTLVALAAALGRDGPIARALGPRSRRPQWSARLALLAAAALAAPWPLAHTLAGALAGASIGALARELRRASPGELAVSLALGAGLALVPLPFARAALALPVAGLTASALASLGATLRGGPGRPPARPIDAAALALLTALVALALGLR